MGNVNLADAAKARRYAQPVLRLDGRAVSPQAQALVSHCLNQLVLPALPPQRPSSVTGIERALAATLAGLIDAAGTEWGEGWLRRPLSNASFTGEPVGRVHFGKALGALDAAGLVEIVPGFQDRATGRTASTRIRLSAAGSELAADCGVTASDIGLHFAKADC